MPARRSQQSSSKRPALTHFLCLPLVNDVSRPPLEESLAHFVSDVAPTSTTPVVPIDSARTGHAGHPAIVPRDAVRPPGTIHLTLGVMSLTEDRLSQASHLLQSLDLRSILETANQQSTVQASEDNDPALQIPHNHNCDIRLTTTLHSLGSTSGGMTTVLYAIPSDPTGVLRRFCLALREPFLAARFLQPDTRPLLLHATIVNTIYARPPPARLPPTAEQAYHVSAKQPGSVHDDRKTTDLDEGHEPSAKKRRGGGGGKRSSRLKIDAAQLMERYAGHIWAKDIPIDRVAICAMGAKPFPSSTTTAATITTETVPEPRPHETAACSSSVWTDGDLRYEEVASVPI